MKKSLEIYLKTIHLGSAKRVATLGINQHDQANDYLLKLGKTKQIKKDYLAAKKLPSTQLTIIRLPDED